MLWLCRGFLARKLSQDGFLKMKESGMKKERMLRYYAIAVMLFLAGFGFHCIDSMTDMAGTIGIVGIWVSNISFLMSRALFAASIVLAGLLFLAFVKMASGGMEVAAQKNG